MKEGRKEAGRARKNGRKMKKSRRGKKKTGRRKKQRRKQKKRPRNGKKKQSGRQSIVFNGDACQFVDYGSVRTVGSGCVDGTKMVLKRV